MVLTMIICCAGCGGNILNAKGKDVLNVEVSCHIQPLWCQLFNEELQCKEREAQAHLLVATVKCVCNDNAIVPKFLHSIPPVTKPAIIVTQYDNTNETS